MTPLYQGLLRQQRQEQAATAMAEEIFRSMLETTNAIDDPRTRLSTEVGMLRGHIRILCAKLVEAQQ
jgi:hypothetical protein